MSVHKNVLGLSTLRKVFDKYGIKLEEADLAQVNEAIKTDPVLGTEAVSIEVFLQSIKDPEMFE